MFFLEIAASVEENSPWDEIAEGDEKPVVATKTRAGDDVEIRVNLKTDVNPDDYQFEL